MPAFTTHLNLYLPGGGSLGIGGDDEEADVDKINQNMQKIDDWADDTDGRLGILDQQLARNQQFTGLAANIGSVVGMKRGDTYQETDDKFRLFRYDGANWKLTPGPYLELSAANTNIGGSTETSIGTTSFPWVEDYDPFGWHDPVTNPIAVKPDVAGRYLVTFQGLWAVNGAGSRFFNVRKNGVNTDIAAFISNPATVGSASVSGYMNLNGTTDYVDVSAWQNAQPNLLLTSAKLYLRLERAT